MIKKIILLFIFIISEISCLNYYCEEGENHCLKCNPLTKLCYKCDLAIFEPDELGGCQPLKQCILGYNYCLECQEDGYLCKKCSETYFPDEIGGCSYTDFCELSYKGNCIKCKEDYILIGNSLNDGVKICKSLNFEDLENCEKLNTENGLCQECKSGFYLNSGDHKCTLIKNCNESFFGICQKCDKNYYLDKIENKCIIKSEHFKNCAQTIDGETCDICDDGYYFDNDGFCLDTNFCEKSENTGKCMKCISGFYLSEDGKSCVTSEYCLEGNKGIGICEICNDNYYLDYKDGKCKSNQEENEFYFCLSNSRK